LHNCMYRSLSHWYTTCICCEHYHVVIKHHVFARTRRKRDQDWWGVNATTCACMRMVLLRSLVHGCNNICNISKLASLVVAPCGYLSTLSCRMALCIGVIPHASTASSLMWLNNESTRICTCTRLQQWGVNAKTHACNAYLYRALSRCVPHASAASTLMWLNITFARVQSCTDEA
jgi:hypothetical protein